MSQLSVSESQGTRSLILQSALSLFALYGYDGVSIRQIAEKSNCNMGSISYHFGGKEGLYRACLFSFDMSEVDEILLDLTDPKDSSGITQKLKHFIIKMGNFCLTNRNALCMLARERHTQTAFSAEISHKFYHPVFDRLTEFLQMAQERNLIRKDLNISFFVRNMLVIIKGETLFYENADSKIDLKMIANEYLKICNRSIYV